ncbi:hypothetical protein FA15DRAFT_658320 [Coprinopsis marcescibilis]|uniref:Uncharacterized protein n=1 Tax=Coprinopsis marcescibilis TaxID=230819 RepID=A0A5C3KLZ3_COPMA|nr:hypothetical protein FA15DRAFT_658320 [Coprinopsis marcescibilis]
MHALTVRPITTLMAVVLATVHQEMLLRKLLSDSNTVGIDQSIEVHNTNATESMKWIEGANFLPHEIFFFVSVWTALTIFPNSGYMNANFLALVLSELQVTELVI